jgi:hypothetical protein
MIDLLDRVMDNILNRIPEGIREPLVNILAICGVCTAVVLIIKLVVKNLS